MCMVNTIVLNLSKLFINNISNNPNLVEVKKNIDVPVLVGSGVTINNVHKYKGADGFIIGSHFKKNGMYVLLLFVCTVFVYLISK